MESPFQASDVLAADPQALAQQLANDVAGLLAAALALRPEASLVVSGGSTPVPFLQALASRDIEWARVRVTLADERWVDASHPDSNERLVKQHLLVGKAASATFIRLKNRHDTPQAGESDCNAALAALSWPLDVVVLGMGGDGHTASLFPDTPGLQRALSVGSDRSRCQAMQPPGAAQARMTLTLAALHDCEYLLLHITGQAKREVLIDALQSEPDHLPVAGLLTARRRARIYWAPEKDG